MEIFHSSPRPIERASTLSVAELEAVLGEWFDREIVVTSSGRAALLLALTDLRFNRYQHRIKLPRLISGCVLDATIRCAFPVDAASGGAADATLLYHQYGFEQARCPDGLVIEDICHRFFETSSAGRRTWAGDVAVFSLPKFFGCSSMVGGLILKTAELSNRFRALRDQRESASDHQYAGEVFRRDYHRGGDELEHVYLNRLLNPNIASAELGAVPDRQGLQEIGAQRRQRIDRLLQARGNNLPEGWLGLLERSLPFLFPFFAETPVLHRLKVQMNDIGLASDIYQLDVNRNAESPSLGPALLIPCHQDVPEDVLASAVTMMGRH
jgi:hypothetical protein